MDAVSTPLADYLWFFSEVFQPGECQVQRSVQLRLVTINKSVSEIFLCPKSTPRVITYRDIKRIDDIELKEDAAQLPWHMIWTLRTVDEKVDLFNTLILQLYDKHAPLKTKRTRKTPAPWMTTEIRSLMSERDLAYRKYTRNKNDEYFNLYKHLRNRTTQLIRNAKLKYSYKLIEPNTTPSELWKNLKVIGLGRASEQADIPIPLDRLNEHFVKDPTLNNTTKQDTVLPDSAPPTRDKFYFTDVTPIDVMKAIRRIKTKAQGPDNISILLIQKIQDIVIPTIAHIFNSSLITSTFPKIWKQAFVLPLPKVKVPTDPNDYRPISILPAISKALERIVHRQITNYMNEHKLFDKRDWLADNASSENRILEIGTLGNEEYRVPACYRTADLSLRNAYTDCRLNCRSSLKFVTLSEKY
ncbi:hypothetical protein ANN_21232 [Periplaneta americana]|uniref:Uncharacterized protein n=1 Tax=Periplaneta americana TaxID=6978 RepID=A0ABQ8SER9_PERAM|nr:hypothetical protein ANN_21232 [Periplaneta americana]